MDRQADRAKARFLYPHVFVGPRAAGERRMADLTRIREVIEGKLASGGMELFDLKFVSMGRRSSLRVYIDKPGGVTIADCERVSHELSLLLDVEEFSNTPYTLEVSSPGLDRPLKTVRDYSRVMGERVSVTLSEAVNGRRGFTGNVSAVDDAALTLLVGGAPVEVPFRVLVTGRLEIEF